MQCAEVRLAGITRRSRGDLCEARSEMPLQFGGELEPGYVQFEHQTCHCRKGCHDGMDRGEHGLRHDNALSLFGFGRRRCAMRPSCHRIRECRTVAGYRCKGSAYGATHIEQSRE